MGFPAPEKPDRSSHVGRTLALVALGIAILIVIAFVVAPWESEPEGSKTGASVVPGGSAHFEGHDVAFDYPAGWVPDPEGQDLFGIEDLRRSSVWLEAFGGPGSDLIVVAWLDRGRAISPAVMAKNKDAFARQTKQTSGRPIVEPAAVAEHAGSIAIRYVLGPGGQGDVSTTTDVNLLSAGDAVIVVRCDYPDGDPNDVAAACNRLLETFELTSTGPVPVAAMPPNEVSPSASDDTLAWVELEGKKAQGSLVVRDGASEAATIDVGGPVTTAHLEVDGRRIAYTRWVKGEATSPVGVYDPDAERSVHLPERIQVAGPTPAFISGDSLLYARLLRPPDPKDGIEIVLADLETGEERVLAKTKDEYMQPGGLAGDFAVWWRCPESGACDVFRHQLSTGETVKVPRPTGANYHAAVIPDGTVYYVNGHPTKCGIGTQMRRFDLDGTVTTLANFPDGFEVWGTFADPEPAGTAVYFQRVWCGLGEIDAYRLIDG